MTEMVKANMGYMPAPAPCYQWEEEFEQLLDLYRERKPKCVLEIGTYCGGTLYHWLQNAVVSTVVSVDDYRIVKSTGGTDNRALYQEWVPDGVELVVIDGNSRRPHTIEQAAEHGPYDWIFIDAGHLYEEVKDDWENYGLRMHAERGMVIFHDILPPSRTWPDIQVAWLWKEIKQTGYKTKEIISDLEAEWGGIGVVYM